MNNDLLRGLPSVEKLAQELEEGNSVPRAMLIKVARETVEHARTMIFKSKWDRSADELAATVREMAQNRIEQMKSPVLVINATGVVLHTGLGRAPLSATAVNALKEAAGYCTLEISRETGERQSRLLYIEELLQAWTGAESAIAVNNNAAGMFLCLNELALGRKVVIARSELVEIGGSFRLPDILKSSGVEMVEIGTTNKVRLSDYERVLDDDVGLIITVHSSNYRIVGFTEYPSLKQLVELGRENKIPILFDIGSGAGDAWHGLIAKDEPIVQNAVEDGADLVAFSGDKLLGGPQAGIIVGREELVTRLKTNPMARALRIDKLVIAALSATLELYLADEELLRENLPVFRMIPEPEEIVKARAAQLIQQLNEAVSSNAVVEIAPSTATIGGGSVPGEEIQSWAVTVKPANISVTKLSKNLRTGAPSVFGYIFEDVFRLDLRTVSNGEVGALAEALEKALSAES